MGSELPWLDQALRLDHLFMLPLRSFIWANDLYAIYFHFLIPQEACFWTHAFHLSKIPRS